MSRGDFLWHPQDSGANSTLHMSSLIYAFAHLTLLQKKKFDSADYFTEHEKLKKAAGLGGGAHGEPGKDGSGGTGGHGEEAKKQ